MVVRNCSSFLIKRNSRRTAPNPITWRPATPFRYNGLIHRKTVGVEPAAESKGVVVVMKRGSGQRKADTSFVRTTIDKNARATLSRIPHMIRKDIRICVWPSSAEPAPSCAARSLWWWRESGPAPRRAPQRSIPFPNAIKLSTDLPQKKKKRKRNFLQTGSTTYFTFLSWMNEFQFL